MRSEERAHNERLANDRYREAGRDKHPLRSLRSLLFCILYFSCFIALVSCHYSRPNLEDEHLSKETRDSLAYLFERHYTWNTNLEVLADSVNLACLPVKDCYNMLYRGDRVVVAEFAIHPADSVDSVWGEACPFAGSAGLVAGVRNDACLCSYRQHFAGHLLVQ